MKTPCPPLENKGSSNALDGGMKDNPGINSEPDMGKSLDTPRPNIKTGVSKGSIDSFGDDDLGVKKDPYGEAGYYE